MFKGTMIILKLNEESIDQNFIDTISTFRPCMISVSEAKEIYRSLPINIEIYIAKDSNKTIASGTLLIEQKFIHNGGKVAHIEDIIVHPDYRGRGIGKLLIEHLLFEADKKNCYKTILDCDESVSGFYEKFSFKKSSLQMRKDS